MFLEKVDDMTMTLTDNCGRHPGSRRNYRQEKHEEATLMIQIRAKDVPNDDRD